jgi:hypothetical protein
MIVIVASLKGGFNKRNCSLKTKQTKTCKQTKIISFYMKLSQRNKMSESTFLESLILAQDERWRRA